MNAVSRTPPSVPLRDLATFNPPAPTLNSDDEVTFVPMAAVSEAGIVEKPEHLRVADLKPGYSYMQSGDVLIAKITPCFENNKIALAVLDRPHGFGSTEFHVVRVDASALDNMYLVHFLRQDEVRRAGERRMTGSAGQRRVPRQFFEELAIPLPPLDEQRRIAAILDQADDLRRKRRDAIARTQTLAARLVSDTFDEADLDPTLGEVCNVQGGLQLTSGRSKLPIIVPYLRVANVYRDRLDLDEIKTIRITETELR